MSDKETIYRQDAVDALCELYEYQRAFDPTEAADLVRQGIYLAEKKIEQMPSADRPSGHWVLINRGLDIYMCDRCGEILQIDSVPIWDYCPVCGVRMEGETDGRPNKQTGCDFIGR